ncbi:unnamed protein product, partial [Acanthoscelides obtectus]
TRQQWTKLWTCKDSLLSNFGLVSLVTIWTFRLEPTFYILYQIITLGLIQLLFFVLIF